MNIYSALWFSAIFHFMSTSCGIAQKKPPESVSREIPPVPTGSGQIVVNLLNSDNLANVDGYVVGKKDVLKLSPASNGTYFIDNVPAGKFDVILTASQNVQQNDATSKTHGLRLGGVEVLSGVRTTKSDVSLTKLTKLTGKVTMQGRTDNTGVSVYIPGTSFIGMTSEDGTFELAGIPQGIHNLRAERDGFGKARIEALSLESETPKTLDPILLPVDTGAEGFLILQDGASEWDERNIRASVTYLSGDPILMKVSENSDFIGSKWVPLNSSFEHQFKNPGPNRLCVKFANENGLESSPICSDITITLFRDDFSFSIDGQSPLRSRRVAINFQPTRNMKLMKVSTLPELTDADWEPAQSPKQFTFPTEGSQTVYMKFKNTDDSVSRIYSKSFIVDVFPDNEGAISFGSGEVKTKTFTANIEIPQNATQMIISTKSDFSDAVWELPSSSKVLSVSSNGCYKFFLRFRDQDLLTSDLFNSDVCVSPAWSRAYQEMPNNFGSFPPLSDNYSYFDPSTKKLWTTYYTLGGPEKLIALDLSNLNNILRSDHFPFGLSKANGQLGMSFNDSGKLLVYAPPIMPGSSLAEVIDISSLTRQALPPPTSPVVGANYNFDIFAINNGWQISRNTFFSTIDGSYRSNSSNGVSSFFPGWSYKPIKFGTEIFYPGWFHDTNSIGWVRHRDIQIFNAATNSWRTSTISNAPSQEAFDSLFNADRNPEFFPIPSEIVEGKIYLFFTRGNNRSGQSRVYDIASNSFAALPDSPFTFSSCSSVVVGTSIFYVSCFDVNKNEIVPGFRYETTTGSWTEIGKGILPKLNEPNLVNIGGKILIYGGYLTSSTTLNTSVYIYDPALDL